MIVKMRNLMSCIKEVEYNWILLFIFNMLVLMIYLLNECRILNLVNFKYVSFV